MKKGVVGLSLLLIFSLIPAYSATPIKSGSVCSKQGQTKTFQGKKFTCIKSGKKLVWNKGVVVTMPTPTPTPTPSPSPTWKDPLEGTRCTTENARIPNQIFELVCLKYSSQFPGSSDNNLYWFQNNKPVK